MELIPIYIGALVSLAVQGLKMLIEKYVSEKYQTFFTLGSLAVISLVVASGYEYLKIAGLWESFYQIVITASAVYALVIRQLEK